MADDTGKRRDSGFEPIKRGDTSRTAAKRIREMIVEGRFADGSPLRQERLAEELGVSRVPLREALRLLETEGLIELRSNRGAVVKLPTPDEIAQLAEMRAKIEGWLLSIAIDFARPKDIEKLEGLLEKMASCSDEDWSGYNMQFHSALLAPANREIVIQQLKGLHRRLFERFHLPILRARNRQRQEREHVEILEAFRRKDVDTAVEKLEAHIMLSAQPVVDRVRVYHLRKSG